MIGADFSDPPPQMLFTITPSYSIKFTDQSYPAVLSTDAHNRGLALSSTLWAVYNLDGRPDGVQSGR